MRAEDKQKPVPLTVKVHPKVLAAAQEIGAWLNGSSLDHVVSEAILDAAKDKDLQRWRESRKGQSEPGKPAEVKPEGKPQKQKGRAKNQAENPEAEPGKAVA